MFRRVVLRIGEMPQVVRFRTREDKGVRGSLGLFGRDRSPVSWLVCAHEEFTAEMEVDLGSKIQPDVKRPALFAEMVIGEERER